MSSPDHSQDGQRAACVLRSTQRRSRRLGTFLRHTGGMAAAEVALLALLFIGMSLMVGRILRPGIKAAATNLNTELAGGISH